MRLENFYN